MIGTDLSKLNTLTYAKSIPAIPLVYIYSKTDQYISLQDTLTIYETLPSDYKCFVESGVKHNQHRNAETINFVFFRIQKIISKKNKKNHKIKNLKFEKLNKKNSYNFKISNNQKFKSNQSNKIQKNDLNIKNNCFERYSQQFSFRKSYNTQKSFNLSDNLVSGSFKMLSDVSDQKQKCIQCSNMINSADTYNYRTKVNTVTDLSQPQPIIQIKKVINSHSDSTHISNSKIQKQHIQNIPALKKNYYSTDLSKNNTTQYSTSTESSVNTKLVYVKNKAQNKLNSILRHPHSIQTNIVNKNKSASNNKIYFTDTSSTITKKNDKQFLKPLPVQKYNHLLNQSSYKIVKNDYIIRPSNSTNTSFYYKSGISVNNLSSQSNNVIYIQPTSNKNIYQKKFSKTSLKKFY